MTQINFLHLSDLHLGVDGMRDIWPRIEQDLRDDLTFLLKESGGLDLVLFTGDLTQRGSTSEFAEVTNLLNKLWEHFIHHGLNPKFLAVPGNHDMTWPDPMDSKVIALTEMWEDERISKVFWDTPDNTYKKLVDEAFTNYKKWWDSLGNIRASNIQSGYIPGDFSATFSKENITLGILGLNSAFLQLKNGMPPNSLALSVKQFTAACNGNGPAWVRKHDACILMTHHPAEWLQQASRSDLEGEIHYPPESFALHLFGHMHDPELRSVSIGAGNERRRLQGAALFSNEPWGSPPVKTRLCGYSIGKFNFNRADATLEFWPRKAEKLREGGWKIQLDQENFSIKRGAQCTEPKRINLNNKLDHSAAHFPPTLLSSMKGYLPPQQYAALVGPTSFRDIHHLLANWLIKTDLPDPVRIKNIALDMEMTWPLIRDEIMSRCWGKTLVWQSLLADGSAESIKGMQKLNSMISAKMAETRVTEIKDFCKKQATYIAKNNIRFSCRAYSNPPFIHGFLIDDQVLFMGLCSHDGSKWSTSQYIQFMKVPVWDTNLNGAVAMQFIKVFNDWFDTRWREANGNLVWPINHPNQARRSSKTK